MKKHDAISQEPEQATVICRTEYEGRYRRDFFSDGTSSTSLDELLAQVPDEELPELVRLLNEAQPREEKEIQHY